MITLLLSACAHATPEVASQPQTAPTLRHTAAAAMCSPAPRACETAVPLAFAELYEAGTPELQPSKRALELAGKRVRMVGFMAKLELSPRGAFYLTPRPLVGDESGGGTADLPPDAVLVHVPFAVDSELPHVEGGVEVVGRFDVGNQPDAHGLASAFRIQLDPQNPKLPGQ